MNTGHAGLIPMDAEHAVLGALLLCPESFDRLTVPLAPEHFSTEAHRAIYAAIAGANASGKPSDIISIAFALLDSGKEALTGGLAYLGEMANNVPGAAGIASYASIVFDKARIRAILAATGDIAELARSPSLQADELASQAQTKIHDACETRQQRAEPETAKVWALSALEAMERRIRREETALPTGFLDLDHALGGGFNPGNLVFIAARPGMGKTSLALQIAQHAARNGRTALFCSQEMGGAELSLRQQSALSGVPLSLLVSGELGEDEQSRITVAIQEISGMPLYIDEQGSLSFADVAMKARQVRRKAKGLDLLVVDYLQLMRGQGENRNAEIEKISRAMKGLAKEMQIPVIVLSQLNRELERRPNKRPVLSDLRDSGAIEQDADIALMVYRDELYDEKSLDAGTAEILIRKHRQGKTGDIRLSWQGETTSFGNLNWRSWEGERAARAAILKAAQQAEKRKTERAF